MGSQTADSVLQIIHKNFTNLQIDDKKYYNGHYLKVLQELINQMKFQDAIFNDIFERVFYAGSFYDGLKIGKPEEYDVDVVMRLPVNYNTVEFKSKRVLAGFTKVRITEMDQVANDSDNTINIYKEMDSWTDNDGYLLQSEFRNWMVSVVEKTLATLPKKSRTAQLTVEGDTYQILHRPNGPATTLNFTMPSGEKFDVDLVPVIEFQYPDHWPGQIRKNPCPAKESWFIIPKRNSKDPREFKDTFWRFAFHQQEKELINDKGLLKPACRLIKKLRDTAGLDKIVSYFIKTMFLWESDKKDDSYWKNTSLLHVFMDVLSSLTREIGGKNIKYYWDSRNNLLSNSGMTNAEMSDIHSHLERIIQDMNTNLTRDPLVLAKYLLTENEFQRFTNEFWNLELSNCVVGSIVVEENCQLTKKNELQEALNKQQHEMESLRIQLGALTKNCESLQFQLERKHKDVGYLFNTVKSLLMFISSDIACGQMFMGADLFPVSRLSFDKLRRINALLSDY